MSSNYFNTLIKRLAGEFFIIPIGKYGYACAHQSLLTSHNVGDEIVLRVFKEGRRLTFDII